MEQQFFSEQNQRNLYGVLSQDFSQRQGANLSSQQSQRLAKTIAHYMQEIWDVNGPMPLQQLNGEVRTTAARDFTGYLRRADATPTLVASERIVTDVSNQPRMEIASQRLAIQQGSSVPPRPSFESNLLMDTGSRFEQLQQERTPAGAVRPPPPNFQISLASAVDEPAALSLFEQAKKAREGEMAIVAAQQNQFQPKGQPNQNIIQPTTVIGSSPTDANPLVRFMTPPSIQNDPQANPTLAQPIATMAPVPRGTLPQDFIIKQDDIVTYKETEYNLIVYSADRDWLTNTRENRYAFTVNFDVGNNKQGFYYSPTSTKKFKNISRIELVKAIMPSEGLDTLLRLDSGSPPTVNTNAKLNILQFPYVIVHIPELDNNNYGTDNFLDNAFAVLQYDANWYSDTLNISDGYLGMIPKFMKCQKIYQPTPLATLQKLTIELQRPNGLPISDTSDVAVIQSLFFGNTVALGVYAGDYATANYIIIQTNTTNSWFSKWAFTAGNTIQLKGLVSTQVNTYSTVAGVAAAADDLMAWLQRDEGHTIVGIANTTAADDGSNAVGYANLIIIENRFVNPTTGSTALLPFGGSSGAAAALATALYNSVGPVTTTFSGAALINLTHQTNLVFRIITREMDAAARVRPDNL
jgi:hypothetical protein